MKRMLIAAVAALFVLALAVPAFAYTLNADGTGFVGKGEVQTALNLNNAGLQSGTFAFTLQSVSETDTDWVCSRVGPQGQEQTQERSRTTTTETNGLLSSTARVKNQITGFNLNGFDGAPTIETSTEGPQVGSCPSGWDASAPVTGDPVIISGGLYVNGVLLP